MTVSPAYPAKIVPLNMDLHPEGFFLSKGAWMAGECCFFWGGGGRVYGR